MGRGPEEDITDRPWLNVVPLSLRTFYVWALARGLNI